MARTLCIELGDKDSEENTAADERIQEALIDKLLEANGQNQLMEPLLGPVTSTFAIYRRVQEGDCFQNCCDG